MMEFGRVRALLMAGVSAWAISHATSSWAATSDAVSPAETSVGEIVVTAQKRAENIQDVPIAISALTGPVIEQRGVRSVDDLQNEIPGFKFGDFAGAGNLSIRGVGTAFVSGAGQSSVAMYVDGVYLSQPKSFGMVQSDLADIEVLRGPQGTLYGRNSTGGVVAFTTARPTSTLTGGASIEGGAYDEVKGSAYISGPLGDKIRGRLYLEGEHHDGYVLNDFTGQRLMDLTGFGGRISLDADWSRAWTTELRVSTRHEDGANVVLDGFDPRFAIVPAPFNDFDPYRVNSPVHYAGLKTDTLASLKNDFNLGSDVDLVSITGFNHFGAHQLYDTLGDTLIPFPLGSMTHADTFTQELNLRGSTKALKWIAGFYFFDDVQNNHSTSDETSVAGAGYHIVIGPPAASVLQLTNQHSREQSESVFGDVTYEVVRGTRVFAGARVTFDRLKQELSSQTDVFGTIVPGGCSGASNPQTVSSTALTGRVGAQHDFTQESMGYVQYSRGYKSPGFSQSTCNDPYKAETVDSIEAGYKSRWFDGKLTVDAAAFYYDYANFQLEEATLTGIPVVNAPKSHVYGLELSAQYRPIAVLRFDASLELLNARYDQFISQDPNMGVPVGTNLHGVQLDNAPDVSANLGAEFDQGLGSIGSLTWRAEASLTESYHLREFNVPWAIQPGYELYNFYVTYHAPNGHWQLRGFVKNATNVTRLAGVLGFGGALGVFQPPRTYGAEASVKF
jgi:iron complex outermembrane receptor protein